MRTIFEDDRVIVSTNDVAADIVVFSFSPWTKAPPGAAFGADFIGKKHLAGIFFQSKSNDWWNNPSMDRATAIADLAAPVGARRIGFGSSMGAYGALVFGERLGCLDYVAISPQASIDRTLVPWEHRWAEEAAVSTPNSRLAGEGLPKGALVHLLYDPHFAQDRRHVDLIAESARKCGAHDRHWRFGLSGHPTGQALAQTKLLSTLINDMFHHQEDHFETLRDYRHRRQVSRAVALSLVTNRRLVEKHPKMALRALSHLREHQTFDEKLMLLVARLERRLAKPQRPIPS